MATPSPDPILNMFIQSKEFKALCFNQIDQLASMKDLCTDFQSFCEKSFKQLEEFFANRLNLPPSLLNPTNIQHPSFLTEQENEVIRTSTHYATSTKRVKIAKTDYLERILVEYGYVNDKDRSFVTLGNLTKKALPISDERILIKLNNPSAELERDLGPKYDAFKPTTGKKILSANKIYPNIVLSASEDSGSGSNKENINRNCRLGDLTFQNSKCFVEKSSAKPMNYLKPIDEAIVNAPRRSTMTKSSKKRKSNFRKSLIDEFEKVSRRESEVEDEVKLPSEDSNCNKELEELISKIGVFNRDETKQKQVKAASHANSRLFGTETTTALRSTADNSMNVSSSGNVLHNFKKILYSKNNGNLNNESSEVEEDNQEESEDENSGYECEESAEGNSEEEFYSCKDDKEEIDEVSLDEQYDVSNYSSNSSSNVGSYNFHEQIEEVHPPRPKMFQIYETFQNGTGSQSIRIPPPLNGYSQTGTMTMQTFNVNSNPFSNFSNSRTLVEPAFSNGNKTMFHDFKYYLKQQQEKKNQNEALKFTAQKDELAREKRLSRLIDSPSKQPIRVKRVYCNKKAVPMWASDLREIESTSRDQKKCFNPHLIFGKFNVENLDLQEVFQVKDVRFVKERGSSANWKKEYATPSTAKPSRKSQRINEAEVTNTKKAILFNSGLKSKPKMMIV